MKKPLIGINCDLDITGQARAYRSPYLFIYMNYFDAITRAGGIPILLPFLENEADTQQLLDSMDGLMLTGCLNDIDPQTYGAPPSNRTDNIMPSRRQSFDLSLVKMALQINDFPILAICSGMQLLNIAAGGTLIQNIESTTNHFQMDQAEKIIHEVNIQLDSQLSKILGNDPLGVNSIHHQALDKIAPGFNVIAQSSDGITEAIEHQNHPSVLGVQWHPERLPHDKRNSLIFQNFVQIIKNKCSS